MYSGKKHRMKKLLAKKRKNKRQKNINNFKNYTNITKPLKKEISYASCLDRPENIMKRVDSVRDIDNLFCATVTTSSKHAREISLKTEHSYLMNMAGVKRNFSEKSEKIKTEVIISDYGYKTKDIKILLNYKKVARPVRFKPEFASLGAEVSVKSAASAVASLGLFIKDIKPSDWTLSMESSVNTLVDEGVNMTPIYLKLLHAYISVYFTEKIKGEFRLTDSSEANLSSTSIQGITTCQDFKNVLRLAQCGTSIINLGGNPSTTDVATASKIFQSDKPLIVSSNILSSKVSQKTANSLIVYWGEIDTNKLPMSLISDNIRNLLLTVLHVNGDLSGFEEALRLLPFTCSAAGLKTINDFKQLERLGPEAIAISTEVTSSTLFSFLTENENDILRRDELDYVTRNLERVITNHIYLGNLMYRYSFKRVINELPDFLAGDEGTTFQDLVAANYKTMFSNIRDFGSEFYSYICNVSNDIFEFNMFPDGSDNTLEDDVSYDIVELLARIECIMNNPVDTADIIPWCTKVHCTSPLAGLFTKEHLSKMPKCTDMIYYHDSLNNPDEEYNLPKLSYYRLATNGVYTAVKTSLQIGGFITEHDYVDLNLERTNATRVGTTWLTKDFNMWRLCEEDVSDEIIMTMTCDDQEILTKIIYEEHSDSEILIRMGYAGVRKNDKLEHYENGVNWYAENRKEYDRYMHARDRLDDERNIEYFSRFNGALKGSKYRYSDSVETERELAIINSTLDDLRRIDNALKNDTTYKKSGTQYLPTNIPGFLLKNPEFREYKKVRSDDFFKQGEIDPIKQFDWYLDLVNETQSRNIAVRDRLESMLVWSNDPELKSDIKGKVADIMQLATKLKITSNAIREKRDVYANKLKKYKAIDIIEEPTEDEKKRREREYNEEGKIGSTFERIVKTFSKSGIPENVKGEIADVVIEARTLFNDNDWLALSLSEKRKSLQQRENIIKAKIQSSGMGAQNRDREVIRMMKEIVSGTGYDGPYMSDSLDKFTQKLRDQYNIDMKAEEIRDRLAENNIEVNMALIKQDLSPLSDVQYMVDKFKEQALQTKIYKEKSPAKQEILVNIVDNPAEDDEEAAIPTVKIRELEETLPPDIEERILSDCEEKENFCLEESADQETPPSPISGSPPLSPKDADVALRQVGSIL
jgi:hypothetical protein